MMLMMIAMIMIVAMVDAGLNAKNTTIKKGQLHGNGQVWKVPQKGQLLSENIKKPWARCDKH